MQIIWCSISAHGFGHAAQVIPILNAIGKVVKNVHIILRTGVSRSIFEEYLQVSWELQSVSQDIGCIQRGPLDIDVEGTWKAYETFHDNWEQKVAQEAQAMIQVRPSFVLSNISYLAIASAFEAHIPVVAIASLSWDQVLQGLLEPSNDGHHIIVKHIQQEYRKAQRLIRLRPGIDMPAFASIAETGPSFPLAEWGLENVREILKIASGDTLVLIAFGGVPLSDLPLKQMQSCEGFHFLVSGISLRGSFARIHSAEDLPLSFGEIMRQVDVVMSKPGYATITSAVYYRTPVVYVRRYNFVDEQLLIDYIHEYGCAVELTRENFEAGIWTQAIQSVMALPIPQKSPPKPDVSGAVEVLQKYLEG